MKELKLEIGKAVRINNQYAHKIVVRHKEAGYYIETDRDKFGPYLRMFFEKSPKHNDDTFITCYNLDQSAIYRVGIYGLEVADVIDTSVQASKMLNKLFKKEVEMEGCTLLGTQNGYSVFMDSNEEFFVVNNNESIKPVEEYEKFKTYKDLVSYYKSKDIKLYNDVMMRLSKDASFIDLNAAKQIIKGLKFENASTSLQGCLKAGLPYRDSFVDFVFFMEENIVKIKKVLLNNNKHYETELNEKGFYRIDHAMASVDYGRFIRNNPEQYKQLTDLCREKYYEMLSSVEIDESAKQRLKLLLKGNVLKITLKLAKQNGTFTPEMFEIVLKDIIDEDRIMLCNFMGEANSRWLKIVSPEVYNELWNICENAFYENVKMLNDIYGAGTW